MLQIVFSINVHECLSFLLQQLQNIKEYVTVNYVVIINANDIMFKEIKECQEVISMKNVILYPESLNKRRWHGTLTKGIYLNMCYAIQNFDFRYFIVLSSKNLFYNTLSEDKLDKLVKNEPGVLYSNLRKRWWHWPSIIHMELAKYLIDNDLYFSESPHEGLGLTYNACQKSIQFLQNNPDIRENAFNWEKCVEEFVFQSLSLNFDGKYFILGNGNGTRISSSNDYWVNTEKIETLPKNKFLYKTFRK